MRASRATLAATVAALILVLGAAPPASAHDELLGSDPSDGQRLDAAPTEVSLTFSDDVLTIGAAVVVADQRGVDWREGDLTIDGGVVTAPLRAGMPAAGYEIRWRVVSSDGHPITGLIAFTIGDGSPVVHPTTSADAAESDGSTPETASTDAIRLVWIGAGGAALAAGLYALTRYLLRRRRAGAPASAPVAGDADDTNRKA